MLRVPVVDKDDGNKQRVSLVLSVDLELVLSRVLVIILEITNFLLPDIRS